MLARGGSAMTKPFQKFDQHGNHFPLRLMSHRIPYFLLAPPPFRFHVVKLSFVTCHGFLIGIHQRANRAGQFLEGHQGVAGLFENPALQFDFVNKGRHGAPQSVGIHGVLFSLVAPVVRSWGIVKQEFRNARGYIRFRILQKSIQPNFKLRKNGVLDGMRLVSLCFQPFFAIVFFPIPIHDILVWAVYYTPDVVKLRCWSARSYSRK
ncbi:MAG: hypothetical protein BWX80_04203 [Candidatus Hydrogenedentes bacterium ADurb.Bin101]|nr:MAG: hypothetical protein BWX80_04203 [Candidatus Hydrogenedentes bacterium ADurb.Bin101]